MNKQNRLILIDGSAYIFRAYYGLPPMNRPDGTPINAVFGFTNMLVKLIEDYLPIRKQEKDKYGEVFTPVNPLSIVLFFKSTLSNAISSIVLSSIISDVVELIVTKSTAYLHFKKTKSSARTGEAERSSAPKSNEEPASGLAMKG